MPDTCDVVVLLSGTGSNLQALIDSDDVKASPANIRAVISNRADAYGLQRAKDAGIDTRVLDHKAFEGREAFDAALIEVIDEFKPQLVVLAGFMRILSADFVRHYQGACSISTLPCCPSTKVCTPISGRWKRVMASTAAACTL
jgi:Folate-dependent phosphoribosylglycinamide formyltransferase PurN